MYNRLVTYSMAALLSSALMLPTIVEARDRSNSRGVGVSIGGSNGISVGIGSPARGSGLGVGASIGGSKGVNAGAGVSSKPSSGLGVGVGASVGGAKGVNAGVGANVGGKRGVSAGVGASVGGRRGIATGVGASVGGSKGINAGVGASVGGSKGVTAGVSAGIGGSNGIGAGVGVGVGGGTGVGVGVGIGNPRPDPVRSQPNKPTIPSVGNADGGSTPPRTPNDVAAVETFGNMSRSEQRQMLKTCRNVSAGGFDASLVKLCRLLQTASR